MSTQIPRVRAFELVPSTARPIHWWQIFMDLEAKGWTVSRVAVEIEIGRTTLQGWKNIPGTQPKFSDGMALVRLWADVMNLPLDSLPRDMSGI